MGEEYSLIHLSDIHFGQGIHGQDPLYKDIRNEVIRDCVERVKEIGNVNAIIVTGDIAFSGKDEEYKTARTWLNELCEAVGCSEEFIFVVPGNHDVNLDRIKPDILTIHRFLRDIPIKELEDYLTQYQNDPRTNLTLLEHLESYRNFARPYSCDFNSLKKCYWTYDIPGLNPIKFRIVGFNSVIISNRENTEDNLILGQSQYIKGLKRHDNVEFIVVMHHPLEQFRDKNKATEYLESRARIILHGHTHNFDAECSEYAHGFKQAIFCSGAITPPGSDMEYHYNWITISIKEEDLKYILEVKYYPRIWDSSDTKFTTHKIKDGNYSIFQIELPKPSEVPVPIETGLPVSIEKPTVEDSIQSPISESVQNNKDLNNNEHFRRLQYLFWEKLDATQRKQILIELNIIPEVDAELTQTLERHALNTAKRVGKLFLLWEATMVYLPDEEKEANPFKKADKEEK